MAAVKASKKAAKKTSSKAPKSKVEKKPKEETALDAATRVVSAAQEEHFAGGDVSKEESIEFWEHIKNEAEEWVDQLKHELDDEDEDEEKKDQGEEDEDEDDDDEEDDEDE